MSTRTDILKLLSDGQFHSGTDLGCALGVSRAAVCKGVKVLCADGLDIQRISGRGYKLASPVAPLDPAAIYRHLDSDRTRLGGALEVIERVDSTNRYLMKRAASLASGTAVLTEMQRRGRGRRGRTWVATPYNNLLLSLAWRFEAGAGIVAGLSLAAGLAVLKALEEYGVTGAGLKWPNDILWQQRKLAGLLAEVQGEASGPCLVVLGIGVNVRMAERDAAAIDQPWVDLHTITKTAVDRNRLAALTIAHVLRACEAYAANGFAGFRAEWERRHVYHQRPVSLVAGADAWRGIVEGVDESGALWLRAVDGRRRLFHSGEISLRPAA